MSENDLQYEARAPSPSGYVPQGPWSDYPCPAYWRVERRGREIVLVAAQVTWQWLLGMAAFVAVFSCLVIFIRNHLGSDWGVVAVVVLILFFCGLAASGLIGQLQAFHRGIVLRFDTDTRMVQLEGGHQRFMADTIQSVEHYSYWVRRWSGAGKRTVGANDLVLATRDGDRIVHVRLARSICYGSSIARRLGEALGVPHGSYSI